MCVENPVPFHSDVPIIAYKIMMVSEDFLQSYIADNEYKLGQTYVAEKPKNKLNVSFCDAYDIGFHAYKNFEDAKKIVNFTLTSLVAVVEVELSELTYQGMEMFYGMRVRDYDVYVANKCKFIKIVYCWK